jgi:hypothetical protein
MGEVAPVPLAVAALSAAVDRQPYLTLGLLILAFGLVWLALVPSRPRIALGSALAAAPFGLFEYLFYVPEYWTPAQWRVSWIGFGDLLFTFAAGGVAWLLATAPCGGGLTVAWRSRRVARRFVGCSAIGLALAVVIWQAGLPMYIASLLAMWIGWACVVWRYPDLRWLGLVGGPAFAAVYVVLLRMTFGLAPGFHLQWNAATLSGATCGGVPVEEALWALTFGAVWPSFMAYVLEARPVRAARTAG